MAGIKNKKLIEIAILLAVGLVCLCRSYRDIGIKLRLFHNQLKTPQSWFKHQFDDLICDLCVSVFDVSSLQDAVKLRCKYASLQRCHLTSLGACQFVSSCCRNPVSQSTLHHSWPEQSERFSQSALLMCMCSKVPLIPPTCCVIVKKKSIKRRNRMSPTIRSKSVAARKESIFFHKGAVGENQYGF